MLQLLIVDDSVTERVRLSGIASRWKNCRILEADNGRTAMKQIEEHLPDLVLTDLQMPEMDGLELVTAVKEEFPAIPVVLMTAQGSEETAAEALRRGAASYVTKLRLAEDLLPTLSRVHATLLDAGSQSLIMHYLSKAETEFELPNDVSLIKSCIRTILDMLRCMPLGDEAERMRVGLAVEEAALNACYHGNLEIEPNPGLDPAALRKAVAARIYEAPHDERRIHISADISRERAVFVVRDDGKGFDVDTVLAGVTLQSRGLTLMSSIMDEVEFNQTGTEVRMVRYAIRQDVDDFDAEDDE